MVKWERFRKRKESNPVEVKVGVAETGRIRGFKGTSYDEAGLSGDDEVGFLADKVWSKWFGERECGEMAICC